MTFIVSHLCKKIVLSTFADYCNVPHKFSVYHITVVYRPQDHKEFWCFWVHRTNDFPKMATSCRLRSEIFLSGFLLRIMIKFERDQKFGLISIFFISLLLMNKKTGGFSGYRAWDSNQSSSNALEIWNHSVQWWKFWWWGEHIHFVTDYHTSTYLITRK